MEKRKIGSKVITRTKGAKITAYLSGLKSVEDANFKFWVKSRGFKLMHYRNQPVVRLIEGLRKSILSTFRTAQSMD